MKVLRSFWLKILDIIALIAIAFLCGFLWAFRKDWFEDDGGMG